MLAAGIVRISRGHLQLQDRARGEAEFYSVILSIYMSIFSVFPALILQSLSTDLRRHWLRIFIWVLTAAGAIANEVLWETFLRALFQKIADLSHAPPNAQLEYQFIWLLYCSKLDLLDNGILPTLYLALALLGLNTIAWTVYHCFKLRQSGHTYKLAGSSHGKWPRTEAFFKKWGHYLRIVNAALCVLVMWAMLGVFTAYRSEVDAIGPEETDNKEWTFGQVVALATWLPAIIELLTMLFSSPQDGLNKKVSESYAVVPKNETNAAPEKPQARGDSSSLDFGARDAHSQA
ncbi:hypothetical protein F4808DRAFT_75185 [Astrocystis sublimbata]|nr:hypothetical protein F4808DRAFT_75185 [Astrocystis sublimbata]